jgi:hypothetical protein
VQPDKLNSILAAKALLEGGFLARTMICQADAKPEPITDKARRFNSTEWNKLLDNLLRTYHQRRGSPYVLQPTRPAARLLIEHHNKLVSRRVGELADVESFSARWSEWAWRLAVVLHAGRYGHDAHNHSIEADTAQNGA